jgi:hypothetical protein
MKKMILSALAVISFVFANAQNIGQTTKGKWLIEVNTNFGTASASNTSIQFTSFSDDGESIINIGAEVGYFIMDDLSLKIGLGYGYVDKGGNSESFDSFSYKIGAKYYIIGIIPIQIDYNGASTDLYQDPSYFGVQGGYAFFLGDKVSIEPGLRYNFSLDDRFHKDAFQLNIGFVIHL